VLAKWSAWPVGKIDHLGIQEWITELGKTLAPATVAECHRLTRAVLGAAVRQHLIGGNPAEGVRLPGRRVRDTDGVVISRSTLLDQLVPVVPDRHRALVALAGGTGLRWGEAVGVCLDALDLDRRVVRVVRTIVEVSGHTSFKPFPKSKAGRREVPLPGWLVPMLRAHLDRFERGPNGLVFTNEAGKPLRRTLFRSRVWKPSLVRAGLLGKVVELGPKAYQAEWTDKGGHDHCQQCRSYAAAVKAVAHGAADGITFHDLRHSYATWLVDDGVPINMAQKVLGHENASTTLQLYTRRTTDHDRILRALGDEEPPL
jgi:integrase